MKRLLPIILIIIFFNSCVSSNLETQQNIEQNQIQDDLSLINLTSYDDNVYVGVSNPYSTKEKMLEVAIINVAKDILIDEYLVLKKSIVSENKSNLGYTYFDTDELFVYKDENLAEIINSLEILKIYFSDTAGCIVIAEDTRVKGSARIYNPVLNEDGIPTWVEQKPQIDGYIVGVGSTLGYRLLGDSLLAADHEAVYDISSQYGNLTSYLQNYFVLKQTDFSAYSQEGKIHKELAVVEGIQNIDYWYDKENNMFYSLIIMKDDRSSK
jgi:hypothetical protein